ncbi:hypothetical protein, partial [Actinomadura sp. NPDC000600]|uniref:hypothetical protein n=1 Tax=Actinomadura sp. NPDC000600 TaxID=3154262 RepID=UPI00339AEA3D
MGFCQGVHLGLGEGIAAERQLPAELEQFLALEEAGVALFTLSSLACGISQDPAQLIAARAVQGLGAA